MYCISLVFIIPITLQNCSTLTVLPHVMNITVDKITTVALAAFIVKIDCCGKAQLLVRPLN